MGPLNLKISGYILWFASPCSVSFPEPAIRRSFPSPPNRTESDVPAMILSLPDPPNKYADPDFTDKMMEVTKEKLLENPKMTEEMVDKSIEIGKKFANPFLATTIWIALSAVFGLIYSLIGGLSMKTE